MQKHNDFVGTSIHHKTAQGEFQNRISKAKNENQMRKKCLHFLFVLKIYAVLAHYEYMSM